MDKQSLPEIQQELKNITASRKQEESHLEKLQKELDTLQNDIGERLEHLRELKDQESALQQKVFLMQKESIKDAFSSNGLKKLFSDNNPIYKKMKEIKDALDGTAFDKQWLDEQYEKYKEACLKKGEAIKSKDEFKIIAMTLKGIKDDASNLPVNELITKAGDGIKKVSKRVQEAFATTVSSFNEEEAEAETVEAPTTKKEGLELWLKYTDVSYNGDNLEEVYESYVQYLTISFKIGDDLLYSMKGGAFKQALNRAMTQ